MDMMEEMMEKFFAGMTKEDKQKVMAEAMTRMMEGVDMMQMMPKCIEMMIPKMPKENRVEFVLGIIPLLVEKACIGMSEDERTVLRAKVAAKL